MKKHILSVGVALLLLGQVLPVMAAGTDRPLSLKARVEEYLSGCIWSSHYAKPRTSVFAENQVQAEAVEEQSPTEDQLVRDSLSLRTRLAQLLEKKPKAQPQKLQPQALQPLSALAEAATPVSLPQVEVPELSGTAARLVEKQVELVDQSSALPETIDNHVLTLEYHSGTVAKVPVAVDFLTDIQLQQGEKLERITLGDAEDWQVSSFLDEARNIYHVYLKPLYEDSLSNIILSTDKHSYQLELVQEEKPAPMVRWYYPLEEELEQEQQQLLATVKPEQLFFDYQVERKPLLAWQPRQVFDDGSRIYITMDPDALKAVNPAIFTRNAQGNLVLVDYEKINSSLVIPKILTNLQLHVNHSVLNIQRGKGHV